MWVRRRRREERLQRHAQLSADVDAVLSDIVSPDAIPDRAVGEGVLWLGAMVLRLIDEHTPDRRGHCPACERRRCVVLNGDAALAPRPGRRGPWTP